MHATDEHAYFVNDSTRTSLFESGNELAERGGAAALAAGGRLHTTGEVAQAVEIFEAAVKAPRAELAPAARGPGENPCMAPPRTHARRMRRRRRLRRPGHAGPLSIPSASRTPSSNHHFASTRAEAVLAGHRADGSTPEVLSSSAVCRLGRSEGDEGEILGVSEEVGGADEG